MNTKPTQCAKCKHTDINITYIKPWDTIDPFTPADDIYVAVKDGKNRACT